MASSITVNLSQIDSKDSLWDQYHVSIIAICVGICIGLILLALIFVYLLRKSYFKLDEKRCQAVNSSRIHASLAWMSNRFSRRGSRSRSIVRHNVINAKDLADFVRNNKVIYQEFREAPRIKAPKERVPKGCEVKNRYSNVIPIEESRVRLRHRKSDDIIFDEYINANFVKSLNGTPNYYIACQAPLESTVEDFWRMIWEQDSRVIIQATKLVENNLPKCAEYLPSSVTTLHADNFISFGDFQVSMEHREVKNNYIVSTVYLTNIAENMSKKITHFWYDWPEMGLPKEQDSIIAMLLEVRKSLEACAKDLEKELKERKGKMIVNGSNSKLNLLHGPLIVQCSAGTGRTGTIIACDMAIQSIESSGEMDLPKILNDIRKERAKAVATQEQYEFIYKVAYHYTLKFANMYKIDIE